MGSSLKNSSTGTVCWGTKLAVLNAGQLACSETGTSVNPIVSFNDDNYGTTDTYKMLYNNLNNNFGADFDVIFFDYDWRMNITTAAAKLSSELSSYSEVILVAHSMGGLVASKFLTISAANRSKTSKLITLGTPYVGSVKSILSLETGQVLDGLAGALTADTFKTLAPTFTSVYELLPTSKYLDTVGGNSFLWVDSDKKTYDGAMAYLKTRDWANKSNGSIKPMFTYASTFHNSLYNSSGTHVIKYSGVDVYTLAGTGQNTACYAIYNSSGKLDRMQYINDGDGTVIAKSAGLGTPNYTYPVDHAALVSYDYAVWDVLNIIADHAGWSPLNETYNGTYNYEVNEKGWIAGLNDCRTEIIVRGHHNISISDDVGSTIEFEGDQVVRHTPTGTEKIGSAWLLNSDGDVQYILSDNKYHLQIIPTQNVYDISIQVNYLCDGFYTSSTDYSHITYPSIELNTSTYADSEVSCWGVQQTNAISNNVHPMVELSPSTQRHGTDLEMIPS